MNNGGKRTDYPVTRIAEDTYMISDFGIANCYLAVGETHALLIDCRLGIGDLKRAVEKITDKPLYVVGTHGHVDHIGGQCQFGTLYLHPLDTGKPYKFMTSLFVRRTLLMGSYGVVDKKIKQKDITKGKKPKIVPVSDGYVFNLGERKITVIHSVGHTYGSIILLDDKTKIMFAGDNICPSPWLLLPNASSVEEWLESANKYMNYPPNLTHGGDTREEL